MSCHKFSYYDYRKTKIGELVATIIATSILEADEKLELELKIKMDKAPFIGCRIDFDYCHSMDCPKESFRTHTCKCGFIQRHITKCSTPKYKLLFSVAAPLYQYVPVVEKSTLVDLNPLLEEMKNRAANLVLTDDEE